MKKNLQKAIVTNDHTPHTDWVGSMPAMFVSPIHVRHDKFPLEFFVFAIMGLLFGLVLTYIMTEGDTSKNNRW